MQRLPNSYAFLSTPKKRTISWINLKSKPNQLDVYIAETKRLQPHTDTDEEEQEEETVGTAPKIVVVEQPSKENVIPTDNVPDTSQAE